MPAVDLDANLSGDATVTAAMSALYAGSSSAAGDGTTSAAGNVNYGASTAVSGNGTCSGDLWFLFYSTISGTASVTSAATASYGASAALSGDATCGPVDMTCNYKAVASLSGDATFGQPGELGPLLYMTCNYKAVASLSGTATVTSAMLGDVPDSASCQGTATCTASMKVYYVVQSQPFPGDSTFIGVGLLRQPFTPATIIESAVVDQFRGLQVGRQQPFRASKLVVDPFPPRRRQ